MEEQYKELIGVRYGHASLSVDSRNGKHYLQVTGEYHCEEKEISKALYDLLLVELGDEE